MPRKAIKKPKKEDIVVPGQKERDEFLAQLKKQGMIGDLHRKLDFVSTGSWVINRLIGDGTQKNMPGGIPRGFITEIYGDESTGKTTLALHIAKQALAKGEIVIYADFEQSLRAQLHYVKEIGIDTTSPNFVYMWLPSLQEGAKTIGNSIIMLKPAVVIIDSVAAMMPKELVEEEADKSQAIGQHARLVGQFINWVSKKLQRYNTALVLINQFRANIKQSQYDPGPKQVTTGGNALRYFCALKIRLKKTTNSEKIKVKSEITGLKEDKMISQEVKVVIEKSKIDLPWKSGPIYLVFGKGIDNLMSLISLGINNKVIKQSGPYLSWKDPTGKFEFKIQGKLALKKHLIDNSELYEALKPFCMPSRDDNEMENTYLELEAKGESNLTDEEKEQLEEIRKIKGISEEGDEQLSDQDKEDIESLNELTAGFSEK